MKYLTKNKHWNIIEDYNIDKILYLLIDRPSEITVYNKFIWIINKDKWLRGWHREYDLPAYIGNDRHVEWYKYSKIHRENNKPAAIWANGCREYWSNGYIIKEEK